MVGLSYSIDAHLMIALFLVVPDTRHTSRSQAGLHSCNGWWTNPKLVIFRTFSKNHRLAGLRLRFLSFPLGLRCSHQGC